MMWLKSRLAIIGGAIGALLFALWKAKRAGAEGERNEQMRETLERLEAGRHAVRDGRDKPLDQRVRDNDAKW